MAVTTNLLAVRAKVAEALAKSPWKQQCTLVAVSKTKPLEDLQEAYEADQRHFGENYVRTPHNLQKKAVCFASTKHFGMNEK